MEEFLTPDARALAVKSPPLLQSQPTTPPLQLLDVSFHFTHPCTWGDSEGQLFVLLSPLSGWFGENSDHHLLKTFPHSLSPRLVWCWSFSTHTGYKHGKL